MARGGGRVRRTDPGTSHDAAERVDVNRLEGLIISFLSRTNPREYAQIEIARMIDEDKWSITPRFRPMEKRGILARCAEKLALNSNNKLTPMEGWRLRRPDEPFTKPKPRKKPPCQWVETEDGIWVTRCGGRFTLTGKPGALGMGFCCGCGKPLRDVPPEPRRKRRTKKEMAAARAAAQRALEWPDAPDWLLEP